MAQRGTNGRPVVLVLTLALVGALLVGLATAGLVASAGATDTAPAGLFNWLLSSPDERPPAVARPCMTALLAADEGVRAVVFVPAEDAADCDS